MKKLNSIIAILKKLFILTIIVTILMFSLTVESILQGVEFDVFQPDNNSDNETVEVLDPDELTTTQRLAVEDGQDWLNKMPMSKQTLIEQLQFQGHSQIDAAFAANYLEDYNQEQAIIAVLDHLPESLFSRNVFINQIIAEGFTKEEAIFAVDAADIDWNNQALKTAQKVLEYENKTKQEIYDYLIIAEFTKSQAKYGAENSIVD